jgi:hypothetical protein
MVVPSAWKSFEVARGYQGPIRCSSGEKGPGNEVQLVVNGTPVDGNIIPTPTDGTKEVRVLVELK